MERFKIQDYSEHPWADTLKQTLAAVEPDTLAELEANDELSAFLSVKVDECIKSIDAMQKQGMDYQEAKEIALADMLPRVQDEPQEWEIGGHQSDMVAAFAKWIGNYKPSQANVKKSESDSDNDVKS